MEHALYPVGVPDPGEEGVTDDKPPPPGENLTRVDVAIHGAKGPGRDRNVYTVPRKGGEVRVTSTEELISGLTKRTAIEIAGVDGKRPEYIHCAWPGCLVFVRPVPRAHLPRWCPEHRKEAAKARSRAQKDADRDAHRASVKEWRKRNPEKRREQARADNRRRAADLKAARALPENKAKKKEYDRAYKARKKAERLATKDPPPPREMTIDDLNDLLDILLSWQDRLDT